MSATNYMDMFCPKESDLYFHNSVKKLRSICLDYLLDNIENYRQYLSYLPPNIKDRLLNRVQTLPISYKNKLYLYDSLIHRDVNVLNFSSTHVNAELIKVVLRCPNLTELTLTTAINTHKISSEDVIDLVSTLKNLKTFRCLSCPAITDEVVAVIVKELPELMHLDLSGCNKITDISLFEISKLSSLKGLKVSKTNVSTQGIIALSQGTSKSVLKELHMDTCKNITQEALQSVCDNCPQLEVLIFNNCSGLNVYPSPQTLWRLSYPGARVRGKNFTMYRLENEQKRKADQSDEQKNEDGST